MHSSWLHLTGNCVMMVGWISPLVGLNPFRLEFFSLSCLVGAVWSSRQQVYAHDNVPDLAGECGCNWMCIPVDVCPSCPSALLPSSRQQVCATSLAVCFYGVGEKKNNKSMALTYELINFDLKLFFKISVDRVHFEEVVTATEAIPPSPLPRKLPFNSLLSWLNHN